MTVRDTRVSTNSLQGPVLLLALLMIGGAASAQSSLSDFVFVGAGNDNDHYLGGGQSGAGSPLDYTGSFQWTGVDSANQSQTMTYTGSASVYSEYGRWHASASGVLSNPYYNVDNPILWDGTTFNANGSPTSFQSVAVARANETLTFEGFSGSAYKVRYLYHIDGFTSLIGSGNPYAEMLYQFGNDIPEDFVTSDSVANWSTQDHELAWGVPISQKTIFAATFLTGLDGSQRDGDTISGEANYASTLTLTGIEVFDPNGDLASGWTVTSSSGTQYNTIQAQTTPEPGSIALFLGTAATGLSAYRRLRKR